MTSINPTLIIHIVSFKQGSLAGEKSWRLSPNISIQYKCPTVVSSSRTPIISPHGLPSSKGAWNKTKMMRPDVIYGGEWRRAVLRPFLFPSCRLSFLSQRYIFLCHLSLIEQVECRPMPNNDTNAQGPRPFTNDVTGVLSMHHYAKRISEPKCKRSCA